LKSQIITSFFIRELQIIEDLFVVLIVLQASLPYNTNHYDVCSLRQFIAHYWLLWWNKILDRQPVKYSIDYMTGHILSPVKLSRRSLFQWLVAARSGIALSRLLLPEHGTAYHRLSRYRRHCRLLRVIWRRTCSQHFTSDAHSSFPSFLSAEHVDS